MDKIKFGTWIPCSERLPETVEKQDYDDITKEYYSWKQSERVLACLKEPYKDYYILTAIYEEDDNDSGWIEEFEGFGISVIAWMPLPELYKEVE